MSLKALKYNFCISWQRCRCGSCSVKRMASFSRTIVNDFQEKAAFDFTSSVCS